MAERPDLNYDAFLVLAHQEGFEMDISHLKCLFPEVQVMFQRIRLLDQVETSDIQPGHGSITLTDAVPLE